MIKGLHHNAYRCRTPRRRGGSTRIPGAAARRHALDQGDQDRAFDRRAAHLLRDGQRLLSRFLRGAGSPVSPSRTSTISTSTSRWRSSTTHSLKMMAKGKAEGREVRGISDHDFIDSIYFRDTERLCDRADREAAGSRRAHGPQDQPARERSTAGRRARPSGLALRGPRMGIPARSSPRKRAECVSRSSRGGRSIRRRATQPRCAQALHRQADFHSSAAMRRLR